MCGIAGIIGRQREDSTKHIPLMVERLNHRGPDGQGYWFHDHIAFGHARLAIIDTSDAGAQPMHHDEADLHLIVNGEIYNYPSLRSELEEAYAIQCRSNCDSEIILHGFAHEGVDFFKRLNGMFALALYDGKTGHTHLVRDRVGIKPLYYTKKGGHFAFASEIKSLIAAFECDEWVIDGQGLHEYLAYQTPLGDRTLFRDVFLLPPASHLIVDQGGRVIDQRPFWSPSEQGEGESDFQTASQTFRDVFSQSVSRHLLSDVPVCATLSAGFDSASVLAQASQLTGSGLTGYTGAFGEEGGWYDETSVAQSITDRYGGEQKNVSITYKDFEDHLDDMTAALDEPRMGMGAFSQYMVARAAARDYKVILTGHGGDELFSGYPIFKIAHSKSWTHIGKGEIPHLVYFALSAVRGMVDHDYGRFMPVLWSGKERTCLLGFEPHQPVWNGLNTLQSDASSALEKIYRTYLNVYLPNLLVVEDKLSMAHALESRTPILDNAMLDLSLATPQHVKLHDGRLKALIKQNGRDLLPPIYYEQPKRGFPTPLRQWLRGPLRDFMHDRLNEQGGLSVCVDSAYLSHVMKRYDQSWKSRIRPLDEIQSHCMWQLLSLESWIRGWKERYDISLKVEA